MTAEPGDDRRLSIDRGLAPTPWEVCADLYDLEYDRRTPRDLPFYLAAARRSPPLLELACGTGRLAIPIARAGVDVVGLEPSPAMLERARAKAGDLAGLRWVEGRMEAFDLGQRFGAVAIAFSSFYELLTVADQVSTLENVRRHLRPGGRLVLDMFSPHRGHFAAPAVELRDAATGHLHRIRETAVRDDRRQLFRIDRSIREFDASGAPVGAERHLPIAGRFVRPDEMRALLDRCGFEVLALHGGFSGEPFDESSGHMVWTAARRRL